MKPDVFPDNVPNFFDMIPALSGDKLLRFKRDFGRAVHDVSVELDRRALAVQASQAPEPDRLLSAREAAQMLSTTPDHVWAMMRRGTLPTVHVGKKYKRVPLAAVRAVMAGQSLDTRSLPPVESRVRLHTPRIGRRP